ncbi:hypothetical protein OH817_03920 [Kocuria rhizophila]|uniref:hypothetical protein n=1 Tax=Kocuria rhizophila TaxID=72000 RepID=UPI002ED67735|nr:hypothetical protein OH817_03920 [Kocuria rhizophila]
MFGGEEFPQRRADVVADDFIVGDVDVGEDRLVELASGGFTGVEIQLVGVLEQVDVGVEERSAAGEVTVDLAELVGDALSVAGNLPEALADPLLRE